MQQKTCSVKIAKAEKGTRLMVEGIKARLSDKEIQVLNNALCRLFEKNLINRRKRTPRNTIWQKVV